MLIWYKIYYSVPVLCIDVSMSFDETLDLTASFFFLHVLVQGHFPRQDGRIVLVGRTVEPSWTITPVRRTALYSVLCTAVLSSILFNIICTRTYIKIFRLRTKLLN